jgi:beta-glucanase (GH16 family)
MKRKLFLLVMSVVFVLASCKKDEIQPPVKPKPQSMDELTASPTFDWKTTKEYQLILKGNANAVVKVLSPNGNLYHKALLKANMVYSSKVTLPSYEKKVKLQYADKSVEINLTQNTINYNFN